LLQENQKISAEQIIIDQPSLKATNNENNSDPNKNDAKGKNINLK